MRASGTSLAAPFVTGAIACLYEASPGAPLATIKDALFKTARKEPVGDSSTDWNPTFGHGRMFPSEAVAWIKAHANTETDRNQ